MDEPLTPSRLWQVRAPYLALAPGLERAPHAGNSSLIVHPGTWKRCPVLTVATSGPWGVVLMEEGVGGTSANSSLSGLSLVGGGSPVSCWGVPGWCGGTVVPGNTRRELGPGLQLSCQHSCWHSLVSGHC